MSSAERCFLASAEEVHYSPGEEIVMQGDTMNTACIATHRRLDVDPEGEVKVTELDL